MQWTKPEFEEVSLAMEVTAYVNTDASNPINHRAGDAVCSATDESDEHVSSLSAG